jgi:hypothetical protein
MAKKKESLEKHVDLEVDPDAVDPRKAKGK